MAVQSYNMLVVLVGLVGLLVLKTNRYRCQCFREHSKPRPARLPDLGSPRDGIDHTRGTTELS